jgi:rare lipoprotein A
MSSTHKSGGYYLDDGPEDSPPANLEQVPDAAPQAEPQHPSANRPYAVLGQEYTPEATPRPYRARGIASWYGRRFHGNKTSMGEIYDMYAMTAAHRTLPLPSYARVTHLGNGRSVVVRVNDRGPFHGDRVIDLSYTAAFKLDMLRAGSAWVEIEAVFPEDELKLELAKNGSNGKTSGRNGRPSAVTGLGSEASSNGDTRKIYLQLGAFQAHKSADDYLRQARSRLASAVEQLSIFLAEGLFRVSAGPYPSAAEARKAADRIGKSLGTSPVLTLR